jgi:hypothetical protein
MQLLAMDIVYNGCCPVGGTSKKLLTPSQYSTPLYHSTHALCTAATTATTTPTTTTATTTTTMQPAPTDPGYQRCNVLHDTVLYCLMSGAAPTSTVTTRWFYLNWLPHAGSTAGTIG